MPLLQENQAGTTPLASTSAIREDLADYIAIVDAKSTPFVSMAPKGKDIGNMQFSWQESLNDDLWGQSALPVGNND
jgi:hypothetical protein